MLKGEIASEVGTASIIIGFSGTVVSMLGIV